MLRTVIGLVVAAHGIGHILFLVPLLGFADWGQSTRSWLFTGEGLGRFIGSVIWIVAIVMYFAAVYGLWNQQAWWRDLVVIACVVSMVGLILFWASPATSPVLYALTFDVAVVIALLFAHWPTVDMVGS